MITYDQIKDAPHIVVIETEVGIRFVEFEGENARDDAADFVMMHISHDFSGRIITAVRYRQTGNLDYAKQNKVLAFRK
jgi:hypothetical protein